MEYVLSQVLVVIAFIFLSITYIINKRRLILFFSILASAFFIGSYYFLGAWSGLAMSVISISRSILFLINNKGYTKITLFDWIVLACSIIALGVCAVVTYDGLLSLCAEYWTREKGAPLSPLLLVIHALPVSILCCLPSWSSSVLPSSSS